MSPNGESYHAPEWPRSGSGGVINEQVVRVELSNPITQNIVNERNEYIAAMCLMRKDGIDVDAYMMKAREEYSAFCEKLHGGMDR